MQVLNVLVSILYSIVVIAGITISSLSIGNLLEWLYKIETKGNSIRRFIVSFGIVCSTLFLLLVIAPIMVIAAKPAFNLSGNLGLAIYLVFWGFLVTTAVVSKGLE